MEKKLENLKNIIEVKFVNNKKGYLKWTSTSTYMSHKIFDKELVVIRKNKVTLTLIKHAYIKLFIQELSKVVTTQEIV